MLCFFAFRKRVEKIANYYVEFFEKKDSKEKNFLFRIELYRMDKHISDGLYKVFEDFKKNSFQEFNKKIYPNKDFLTEVLTFIGYELQAIAIKIIQDSYEKNIEWYAKDVTKYSYWHDKLLKLLKESSEQDLENIYFIMTKCF